MTSKEEVLPLAVAKCQTFVTVVRGSVVTPDALPVEGSHVRSRSRSPVRTATILVAAGLERGCGTTLSIATADHSATITNPEPAAAGADWDGQPRPGGSTDIGADELGTLTVPTPPVNFRIVQ